MDRTRPCTRRTAWGFCKWKIKPPSSVMADVIPVMKLFSLALLCILVIGITTALVLLFSSQLESNRLHNEIAELKGMLDSDKHLLQSRDKQLADGRLGASLLYRMALSGSYDELFACLDAVPDGSLNCKVMDLPESPSIRLFCYVTHPKHDDGTVYVIVQSDSLTAVDCVMHTGHSGIGKSMNEPHRVSWSLPGGSKVKYRILPTGFEQVQ